jgi:pSer/pThr/pTyr-binding forkhead associated (FHA) protein
MIRLPFDSFRRARAKAGRARLVPLAGEAAGLVRLGREPLVIGRDKVCTLVHVDTALSRRHASITPDGRHWHLADLDSANGTTVNGQRVTRVTLAHGDVISFGERVSYRFENEVAQAAESTFLTRVLCARLVPTKGGRPFVLRRRLSVVGRNATADLQLNESQVSGIHARIIRRDGALILRDTGSRNGTMVNGDVVRQTTLHLGDRVSFGDLEFTVGLSPVPTDFALKAIGGGGLALALLGVVLSMLLLSGDKVEPLWTREMYEEQVGRSLVAVVKAHDRTPMAREVALAQFEIARRSLIAVDQLSYDEQTPAEIRAAVHNAAATPELRRVLHGRDIVDILVEIEEGPDALPPPAAVTDVGGFDLTTELSYLVAEFGIDTRDTPIPAELVAEVERYTRFWTVDRRDFTVRAIERGRPHLDMIRKELRHNRLPQIFCYLPFIESGYQASVTSSAGARGLWQFMPATARDYGLRVDDQTDERIDPALATGAACKHLDFLLKIFGPNSFMCAVAAYNKGQNGMLRCLKRNGDLQSAWKFWNLTQVHDGCLPAETIAYVPRFLAAVVVFRNPRVFGLDTTD